MLALAGMKYVPQQFFPNSERPELILDLRMKEGSSFQAATEQVKRMEAVLRKDEDVRFFTAYTGAGAPRFYLALSPELPNPGYAQFIVMTKDMEARERVRSRLMASVDKDFPAGLGARHPPRDGSGGGLSGAVPRGRPRHAEGARDRPRGRTRHGREPEGARRAARLERPGAHAQGRARPGQGACTGAHFRRRESGRPERDERCDAVAAARAGEPGRHRRAGRAERAPRPGHAQ